MCKIFLLLLQYMYAFQYKEFKICGIDHVPCYVVGFMNLAENKEQQKSVLLNDQACLIHDHIKEWQKPGWGKIYFKEQSSS